MFEDLCDRAGELSICIKCGKESHDGTCKDTIPQGQRNLTRHVARSRCCLFSKDILHPMKTSTWKFLRRCPVNLMRNRINRKWRSRYSGVPQVQLRCEPLREGGELHVGQLDLHTNPNGTMKEYNNMLDLFGGANPSVIPQPGDEAVCEGVQGYSCVTHTLPKRVHLEVINMQNRDTSFPYWSCKDYTAFGSNIHHIDLSYTSKALVKILRHQIGQKRGNPIPCNSGGWVNIHHILSREDAEHGNQDCRFLLRKSTLNR